MPVFTTPQMQSTWPCSHIPYCDKCKKHVQPQVVSVTESTGVGVGLVNQYGMAMYRPPAQKQKLIKLCPDCGDPVFSADDVSQAAKKRKDEEDGTKILLILCGIGVVIVALYYLLQNLWSWLETPGARFLFCYGTVIVLGAIVFLAVRKPKRPQPKRPTMR